MTYLSFDFETFGTADLKRVGGYSYARHPDTDIWCLQWAIGDADPELWTPDQPLPFDVCAHIADGGPVQAWNAAFERLIWREIMVPRYDAPEVPLEQWHDTQAEAQAMGLPGSLDATAKALFGDDPRYQKDKVGNLLAKRMARPRKVLNDGTPVWWSGPEKLERLYDYCKQDVVVERAIANKVRRLPETERELYLLTERINDRGLPIDLQLVNACGQRVKFAQSNAAARLAKITNEVITAPTQTAKIAKFLGLSSIAKDRLETFKSEDPIKSEVAAIRLEAGGAAVRKLSRIKAVTMEDGRARGQLRYHGAAPGRWSAQGGIQVQNFKRPEKGFDADKYIYRLTSKMDVRALDRPVLEVVPNLLRSCIVAPEGKALGVLDYSQIEARVAAWFAGEEELLKLFRENGPVYEDMAASLYGVSVEEVVAEGKDSEKRWWGKTITLGAIYQLGHLKLRNQSRLAGKEQPLDWCKDAIDTFRTKRKRIVRMWYELQRAAIEAVKKPGTWVPVLNGRVHFYRTDEWLYMRLPSGRFLSYHKPRIGEGRFGGDAVYYWGRDQKTRQWVEVQGYGGRWTENLCQATARELMAGALLRFEAAGYPVLLTVHDEAVVECEQDTPYEELERIMNEEEPWAHGLPVASEGGIVLRYGKKA